MSEFDALAEAATRPDDLLAVTQRHGRLLVAFGKVVAAVLDADAALIPDEVLRAARDAEAMLDEVRP